MDVDARDHLLGSLERVEHQRQLRAGDAQLAATVRQLKAFQQGRLVCTYPDLLAHARWGAACRFFLDDLYGPGDFAERDRGFARVVPALVRLFPADVVSTVDRLLALHAVSEELDTAMGRCLGGDRLTAETYGSAWRAVGARELREWQVSTVVGLGHRLDVLVHRTGMRTSLRLMRGPAQVAGLGALQSFLERGFDAFRGMGGAREFLDVVHEREEQWLEFLFSGRARRQADPPWLGQFP